MRSTHRRRRPVGVLILAVLLLVGALGAFASSYFYGTPGPVAGVSVVLGLVSILAALALLAMTSRSWWLAMIASASLLALTVGTMILLGRVSFSIEYHAPFWRPLSFGLPIGLFFLALIILVSLIALRGHFGIGAKVAG